MVNGINSNSERDYKNPCSCSFNVKLHGAVEQMVSFTWLRYLAARQSAMV